MNAHRTTLCGSFSLHPVSTGAAMHLAGYAALDLPFTYLPFRVTDLAGAVGGVRALGIRGIGVSMPFKRDVIPLLDALDPLAERIGAVNTIVNDEGRLTGYNTDALGAVRALEEVRPLAGARVLVLGAGGAARAVVFGLVDRGARVTVANRTRARAEELADAAGATSEGWDAVILASSAFDILVNATSRGMVEVHTESPIPASAIGAAHLVMDIVYKPIATTLVLAARSQGATVVHGGRMLLHQAAGQFELYTGVRAPLEAMDAALQAQIDDAPAPAR